MLSLCTSMQNQKIRDKYNYISFTELLPSTGDWQLLRSRMEHVVKKILCKYFPQFSDMEVKDITHQYSEISERKSEIVSESIQTILSIYILRCTLFGILFIHYAHNKNK